LGVAPKRKQIIKNEKTNRAAGAKRYDGGAGDREGRAEQGRRGDRKIARRRKTNGARR